MREPIHNHITRDIKPYGKCRGCDAYWESEGRVGQHPKFNPQPVELSEADEDLVRALLDMGQEA